MSAKGPRVDVAIVGGGPAGATTAIRLARAGLDVVVLERSLAWRWRAGGVFASPAVRAALADLGVAPDEIARIARPIPGMRVETRDGVTVRLTYGAEAGGPSAVGLDRGQLDPLLLELAAAAGARVLRGATVRGVDLAAGGPARRALRISGPDGDRDLEARVVVGADGPRSVVAAAAGVSRPVRLPPRVGLSWHQADPRGDRPLDARMHLLEDGYVGVAPVPGTRVNVGVVLGPSWRSALARDGAAATGRRITAMLRAATDDDLGWRDGAPCDRVLGVAPLGVRVLRRAGPGWFLVGDAAGFLDPFTGEGLHRAFVSAALAARAIEAAVGADDRDRMASAARAYDVAMHRRFASKDAVSWLVQAFLARPALFGYVARRLATRDDVRATMGLVMGDLLPASRGLDPRFLAALLAP